MNPYSRLNCRCRYLSTQKFVIGFLSTTVALKVAFLTITVAFDLRFIDQLLIVKARTLRQSFLKAQLTISRIDLHLLQTIVVVPLFQDVSLRLRISQSGAVVPFLLELSFLDSSVDTDSYVAYFSKCLRTIGAYDLILNIVFQSLVELSSEGFVVLLKLRSQDLELCFILSSRGALLNPLDSPLYFELFVTVSECSSDLGV